MFKKYSKYCIEIESKTNSYQIVQNINVVPILHCFDYGIVPKLLLYPKDAACIALDFGTVLAAAG